MSESKHTPGPWEWRQGLLYGTPSYYLVLTAPPYHAGICGSDADRALITAAPTLLKACQLAQRAIRDSQEQDWEEPTYQLDLENLLPELQAAIAEATQEERNV